VVAGADVVAGAVVGADVVVGAAVVLVDGAATAAAWAFGRALPQPDAATIKTTTAAAAVRGARGAGDITLTMGTHDGGRRWGYGGRVYGSVAVTVPVGPLPTALATVAELA
ncbi:MAG: hypothetical protein ACRD0H_05800, partial [Actinomycetes bacterium]